MNKKKLALIIAGVLVVVAGGFSVWKYKHSNEKPNMIKVTLPDGRVITAYKVPPMNPVDKLKALAATVEGAVALEKTTNSPDSTTMVVIHGLDGQTYGVTNPPFVNSLRMNYVGKVVSLKGYWHEHLNLRTKEIRAIWIDSMSIIEKLNVKKPVKETVKKKTK